MYGVRQFWASTVRPYVRYVIVRKIRTCTAFGLSLKVSDQGSIWRQWDFLHESCYPQQVWVEGIIFSQKEKKIWKSDRRWEPVVRLSSLILGTCRTTFVFISMLNCCQVVKFDPWNMLNNFCFQVYAQKCQVDSRWEPNLSCLWTIMSGDRVVMRSKKSHWHLWL